MRQLIKLVWSRLFWFSLILLLFLNLISLSAKFLAPSSNVFAASTVDIWKQVDQYAQSILLDIANRTNNEVAELYEMGRDEEALSVARRNLKFCEKNLGPTHPSTAASLNTLAAMLKATGDYAEAKLCQERALSITEQVLGPNHPDTVTCLHNLGGLLSEMGDYMGAMPILERALSMRVQVLGPNHPDTMDSFSALGTLLAQMGDYARGKPYLEHALSISEKVLGPNNPDTVSYLNNLGGFLYATKDYMGAKSYLERALSISEQVFGPNHRTTAYILSNLGSMICNMGDLAGGKQYIKRALAIYEKELGPTHPQLGKVLNDLGTLHYAMGDYSGAKPYLERALAIYEKELGPTHPNLAISLNSLATLLQAIGDTQAAVACLTRALDTEEQLLVVNLALGTETQKRNFLASFFDSGYRAVSLLTHTAPKDDQALRLATTTVLRRKGRVLDATVKGLRYIQANSDPAVRSSVEKFKTLHAQSAYLQLHSPEKMLFGARHKMMDELETQLRTIEGQLSAQSAVFQKELAPVTLEEVQVRIPNPAALVDFFVYKPFNPKTKWGQNYGEPNYFAFVLRRSGAPRWVALGFAKPIDDVAESLRRSMANADDDVLERARELDALTMAKIRPLIGDANTLLISPDGALNLVPFAALVDEKGKYLIEKYQLSYLTSGRDLLRMGKESKARQKPLLVGNADFDGGLGTADTRGNARRSADMTQLHFKSLPATAEEVNDIGQLLNLSKKQILTKDQATEAAVKTVKGPEILHLATHGFFLPDIPEELPGSAPIFSSDLLQAPNPAHIIEDPLLRSGLALSGFNHRDQAKSSNDGVLTALEAADLDLWGTEIVTLSACETGVGEVNNGEGVFGLRRALVMAGAQSQLMTLWSVSDEPTKDLMVSWYGQLIQKKGRAEALRQIQLAALRGEALPVIKRALRGKRGVIYAKSAIDPRIAGTRHPFFWASLILSGATGPIHMNATK